MGTSVWLQGRLVVLTDAADEVVNVAGQVNGAAIELLETTGEMTTQVLAH